MLQRTTRTGADRPQISHVALAASASRTIGVYDYFVQGESRQASSDRPGHALLWLAQPALDILSTGQQIPGCMNTSIHERTRKGIT
ncbi:hypothetical protein VTN00DRAFT_5808 [Thermoascus crustaceus]|uniref:uncharacterized protein n=1 Tax=Thermoascus crustaceus TaxID=5088 RepID=UPI0037427694